MKSTQDSQSQEESMSEIEYEGSFISADREAITADARRPKATSFFVTTLLPTITRHTYIPLISLYPDRVTLATWPILSQQI